MKKIISTGQGLKVSKKKPSQEVVEKCDIISSPMLAKCLDGPIISPKTENDWEIYQTFNPGVILLKDKVHLLYRAIGNDYISRLGYAVSGDGFKIDERLPQPAYQHPLINDLSFTPFSFASGGSFGGCEDPRLVRVNKEDTLYMTYTAVDQGLRVALTSIKLEDFLNKKWQWKNPVFISPPGEVHKNWVIFPEKIKGRYAILHSLSPQISIDFFDDLEFDGKTYINSSYTREPRGSHWTWESQIRGVGPAPLKTREGWLIFYHAEDRLDPGKYKVGAMLLDLEEPTKVLSCSKRPILEASELYEYDGFKPSVVYASGAVVKDNKLLIYYGGADNYVCVAYSDLEEFLNQLQEEIEPELKQKF
ncbi:MAG: hypothetical protein PQ964_04160 [Methanobacteriaceae archaeon]